VLGHLHRFIIRPQQISSTFFSDNYEVTTNLSIIRGAYHFAHPDVSSGAAQATYFPANGGLHISSVGLWIIAHFRVQADGLGTVSRCLEPSRRYFPAVHPRRIFHFLSRISSFRWYKLLRSERDTDGRIDQGLF
jgi:hypothetical protein